MHSWLLPILLAALGWTSYAQDTSWKFPCPTNEIAQYTAFRISDVIRIDGKLDEPVWQLAPTSPRFVDIITGEQPRDQTVGRPGQRGPWRLSKFHCGLLTFGPSAIKKRVRPYPAVRGERSRGPLRMRPINVWRTP